MTGKQKRKRKDKKIAVAVQHHVNCELAPRPPARRPPNPTYIARRDLSLFFSIDIVYDFILSNHFIHSSASLATLR